MSLVLQSSEKRFNKDFIGGSLDDILHSAQQCAMLTGSDEMPAVLYKGQTIPRGRLGTRSLNGA